MATPFSHTLQALVADGLHRSHAGLAAVAIVLGAWFGWFLFAEVGIYKTAPAHLQVERNIHAVEATIEARVLTNHMAVGREVGVGNTLVELEDTAVRLKRAEHHAKLDAARAQLQRADLIVFDESFAALDPENLSRAIECVIARAPSLVVITHP